MWSIVKNLDLTADCVCEIVKKLGGIYLMQELCVWLWNLLLNDLYYLMQEGRPKESRVCDNFIETLLQSSKKLSV